MTRVAPVFLSAVLLTSAATRSACAEPFIAVQEGLKCVACHTSPSGGGKRNAFGNVFTGTTLAAYKLGQPKVDLWTGEISRFIAVGGDARAGFRRTLVPGQTATEESGLDELLAYAELRPWPERVTVYADARLRPGDAVFRELYLRLNAADGRLFVRGGDFFLPFGLRLQDDDAFIRQVTGINYNTPDTGVELGFESGMWSSQLAVTRGTAGGPEVDSGKQYSFRISRVEDGWRIGGSVNFNDAAAGQRQIQNLFGGIRTGPVAWLGEIDLIIDDGSPTGRREILTTFAEADYRVARGHNLKFTFEYFDPDTDVSEDQQNRMSLVWEFFPIRFLQTRVGFRKHNGIPQNPSQNREQLFVELHAFF